MLPCLPLSTLFPYTTLFRSHDFGGCSLPLYGGRVERHRDTRAAPLQNRENVVNSSPGGGRHHADMAGRFRRSEEHTSELQSRGHLVCRLLLEKKKRNII